MTGRPNEGNPQYPRFQMWDIKNSVAYIDLLIKNKIINCVILFNILSRILRKITISKQRYKYGNDSVVLFLEVKQMILQEARFHNEISD